MSSGVTLDTLQDRQMLDDLVEAKRAGTCSIMEDRYINKGNGNGGGNSNQGTGFPDDNENGNQGTCFADAKGNDIDNCKTSPSGKLLRRSTKCFHHWRSMTEGPSGNMLCRSGTYTQTTYMVMQ